MIAPNIPLTRGKHDSIIGIVYEGRFGRDLVANSDELRFAICHPQTMQRLVTKRSTQSEIDVSESGEYRVNIYPDDLNSTLLPLSKYPYEVEMVDGTNGKQILIVSGTISLKASPFGTSDPELV